MARGVRESLSGRMPRVSKRVYARNGAAPIAGLRVVSGLRCGSESPGADRHQRHGVRSRGGGCMLIWMPDEDPARGDGPWVRWRRWEAGRVLDTRRTPRLRHHGSVGRRFAAFDKMAARGRDLGILVFAQRPADLYRRSDRYARVFMRRIAVVLGCWMACSMTLRGAGTVVFRAARRSPCNPFKDADWIRVQLPGGGEMAFNETGRARDAGRRCHGSGFGALYGYGTGQRRRTTGVGKSGNSLDGAAPAEACCGKYGRNLSGQPRDGGSPSRPAPGEAPLGSQRR